MAADVVELEGVTKSYREGGRTRTVFGGLTHAFAPAEFACVVGRSGSGKTTLLNLASGIDLPDAGTVRVNGTDIVALPDRERTLLRRRHVGFVFQFFNLIPTLTVAENLRLPLELNRVAREEGERRIGDLLARVGLADRAGSFPDALSGGEQQRVAILRALVHSPRLVLADEPTGNLDAATGHAILDLLTGLVRDDGATLVVVSHSSEAAERADRILRIEDGELRPVSGAAAGAA